MAEYNIKIEDYFLQILLFVGFVLVFFIFQPYLTAILLAFVFATLFRPTYKYLLRSTGNKETLAAIVTAFLIVLIIAVPLAIFATLVFKELIAFLGSNSPLFQSQFHLPGFVDKLNFDFRAYLRGLTGDFIGNIGAIFSNVAGFFLYAVLTVITLVYFFRDGERISNGLFGAMPFKPAQRTKLIEDLTIGVRAVLGGYLFVSVVQGITTGIGFWIFGVPNPALWGFVVVFTSLIPTFGTSMINIPAILYLYATGHFGAAVGLLVWYLIFVSLIDNFLGPRFVSGKVNIHQLLILFSIIGGLRFFGPVGFLIGPLIIIFFWSILEIFRSESSAKAA